MSPRGREGWRLVLAVASCSVAAACGGRTLDTVGGNAGAEAGAGAGTDAGADAVDAAPTMCVRDSTLSCGCQTGFTCPRGVGPTPYAPHATCKPTPAARGDGYCCDVPLPPPSDSPGGDDCAEDLTIDCPSSAVGISCVCGTTPEDADPTLTCTDAGQNATTDTASFCCQ